MARGASIPFRFQRKEVSPNIDRGLSGLFDSEVSFPLRKLSYWVVDLLDQGFLSFRPSSGSHILTTLGSEFVQLAQILSPLGVRSRGKVALKQAGLSFENRR